MRYAVLGDIHSNLSALETVLADARAQGVDRVISVGDVVGYGAGASEAIEVLREVDAVVVKGNHDAACTGELQTTFFNPNARQAVDWTRQCLSEEELDWLRSLPLVQDLEDCSVAHGTYDHPGDYRYVMSMEDADPSLDLQPRPVCFVGHTHVPVTVMRLRDSRECTRYTTDAVVDLRDAHRALVNVGSVGQPRDEDSRAAWGLFDSDAATVEIRRLEYDVAREASRIRAAGLPQFLADRLFLGI